jgi:hypothetical protein
MAWRPTAYLLDGELDNTIQGKVTGFMKFFGLDKPVKFNLKGNFHRDIRGSKIQLINDNYMEQYEIEEAKEYMGGFALEQIGKVGDITGGLPPYDYVKYPYIEWYSKNNGRVVLELEPGQIKFLTQPIPYIESDPIDRKEQH